MRLLYPTSLAVVAAAGGLAGWLWLAPSPPPAMPPLAAPPPPAPAAAPQPAPRLAEEPAPAPARIDDPRHQACLVQAGSDPVAALRAAEALGRAGATDAAEHCAAAAHLAAGRPGEAAVRLERLGALAEAPSQLRAAWYAQAGQAWLMAGDAQRAWSAATLALVLAPDDLDLLTDRAIAAASLGRPFEAIDDFNRVIDLDPARAEAFVYRAGAWRQAGRPELAADDLARALAIDPGNPEAHLERGLLRLAAGDAAGARADLTRAAELAPGTPTEELARAELERVPVR
jgi:tetratricopeptide (TPR) repeat protein